MALSPDMPSSLTVVSALRQLMHYMEHYSRKLDKEYGITLPQSLCLAVLAEQGRLTLSALSQQMYLATSTLVGVVDRLEEKGFVTRTRSKDDRRSVFITLTEQGQAFIATMPRYHLGEKLALLPEEEQLTIICALDQLLGMAKS